MIKTVLRIGGILFIVALLIGAGAIVLQNQSGNVEAEAAAPTTMVARGSIQETVSATGNVSARRQATLAFESSGQIAQMLVEKGQQVEAGQPLARLDTASLEWQVARTQAALDTAQARMEQAQEPPSPEEFDSAQAALDSTLANYERVAAGATAEALASARAAVESARTNLQQVKAGPTKEDLASAQAALDSARAAVQQAQAAYDRVKNRSDVQMLPESLNLQNATIELERAQANYAALVNRPTATEVAAAEAQVAQAEAQLAQLLDLPDEGELSAAEAQIAQAKAQLVQLRDRPMAADVAVLQAQVEEASVALKQAQSLLQDAVIVAPFAGTILATQVSEGEWATPGTPAITLANTESLILDVNVDEADVAKLAEGQLAQISFDALKEVQKQEIPGTVIRIAPSSSNVNGAVAYALEIMFVPGQTPVRLGMTADVNIQVASADDALLVPNRAITADRAAGRYFVTVQQADGTTQSVEVRIGIRGESATEILDGLEEGDQVVLPAVPEQNDASDGSRQGFGSGGPFGRGRPGGGQ